MKFAAAQEAAAVAAAAAFVAHHEQHNDECSNTAELLARLPPDAVANSPADTPTSQAAHAQAVALASASVPSGGQRPAVHLSLIHISEPTRPY